MVEPIVFANRFFFNLSAQVGKGKSNQLADVELVRFGYKMKRLDPTSSTLPRNRALNGLLDNLAGRGPFADDLQVVIDEHEKQRGGTRDGCVSPARHFQGIDGTYDGNNIWIIMSLNNNMRGVLGDGFPRIDLHDLAGPEISKFVRFLFLGPGK